MKPDEAKQRSNFWGELAALLLHPIQIEILEMLLWIDEPLSASELTKVYQGERHLAKVNYHVRRLVTLGTLRMVEELQVRGTLKTTYRLVLNPNSNDSGEK